MDAEKVKQAVRLFLEAIGEDPNRPGLVDTPERVARMCEEIFAGIGVDAAKVVRVIPMPDHDEIVLVKDIPFYSLCEHHLLPFHGVAHVAYLPAGSQLARVVDIHAKRLQVQENLTTAVADDLMRALEPRGVLVIVEAEHLCMTMRGAKVPGSKTVTSVVRGIFRENPATREEALRLIGAKPG
jgi:GTP cyclohydrolase I